jgi:hypothetical protein
MMTETVLPSVEHADHQSELGFNCSDDKAIAHPMK